MGLPEDIYTTRRKRETLGHRESTLKFTTEEPKEDSDQHVMVSLKGVTVGLLATKIDQTRYLLCDHKQVFYNIAIS